MPQTISPIASRVSYTAAGGQATYAVPFEFFAYADLSVTVDDVPALYAVSPSGTTQFSATGAGATGGGTITFGDDIDEDAVVVIERALVIQRATNYPTTGPFLTTALNAELNTVTAIEQDLARDIGLVEDRIDEIVGAEETATEAAEAAAASALEAEAFAIAAGASAAELAATLIEVQSRTYYVDPTQPDNSGDGVTVAGAKQTITAALAALAEGDRLMLRGGPDERSVIRHRHVTAILPANAQVGSYGGGPALIDFSVALDNADFSTVIAQPDVYQITVNYDTLTGLTPDEIYSQFFFQLFEGTPGNDTKLTLVDGVFDFTFAWVDCGLSLGDRLDLVAATPGSFHVRHSDGVTQVDAGDSATTFVFFVHLPDSGDPRSNDKEYAISSAADEGWVQLEGGTLSDVQFVRSGHRNGLHFERAKLARVVAKSYAVHGMISNSTSHSQCESYGAGNSVGACFHGFRDTAGTGTDEGNRYVGCRAQDGAWGFYSHGTGVVPAQQFVRLEDCRTIRCERPHSVESVEGLIEVRGRHESCGRALSTEYGTYTDTKWFLETGHNVNDGAIADSAGTLTNCYIGKVEYGRRLLRGVDQPLTFIDCTVQHQYDGQGGYNYADSSTRVVTLTNSIWPGEEAYILAATGSYLAYVNLTEDGGHLTNAGIVGCHGPLRAVTCTRQPDGDMDAASLILWPQEITTFCRPDKNDGFDAFASFYLEATDAADKDLIQVGTPLWLYRAGIKPFDAGVFWVTARAGDHVTVDRNIALPFSLKSFQYRSSNDGTGDGGDWYTRHPMPRYEIRLAAINAIHDGSSLTLGGGTVVSISGRGHFDPDIVWDEPSGDHLDNDGGYTQTVTIDPVLADDLAEPATFVIAGDVIELYIPWQREEYRYERAVGYLRDLGIGCTL